MSTCTTSVSIQIGDVVRCSGTFRDSADALVNPTTVTFKLKDPNGVVTTYVYGTNAEVLRPSTGLYVVDVEPTMAGTYKFRFSSTGTGKAAGESSFTVDESDF